MQVHQSLVAIYILFLIEGIENVFGNTNTEVLDGETSRRDESDNLILPYCNSEGIGQEDGKNLHEIFVPSIAMTNYVPRRFRLKKVQSMQCDTVKEVVISFDSYDLSEGKEFFAVNGTAISTESSYIIYDPEKPENNNVSVLKKTNRLDNLLTPRGMLKVANEYYYPDEFCIQKVSSVGLIIKACEIDCENGSHPCLNICCPLGEVVDLAGKACQYSGDIEWRPTFYTDVYTKVGNSNQNYPHVHYKRILITCAASEKYVQVWPFRDLPDSPKIPIKVLNDGRIKYLGPERKWQNLEEVHCVSGLQNYIPGHTLYYTGSEEDQIIYLCSVQYEENRELSFYYVGAMMISCVFLLLTATIYILLWEKQNIHGWTILSFVISTFFLFIFLSAAHLLGHFGTTHRQTFYCVANGALAHFFFLSTFCWLSIINFDVWWTLRCNTPFSERTKGIKRFCFYLIFAWGGPVVVIIVAFILQHIYADIESLVMVPDYGHFNCFISKWAQGVYIYYLMGVLMISNFIFMSLTFYTLYRFRQGTVNVRSASTHQQNSFHTLIKLFVVMGVTWSFEVISWQYGNNNGQWYWVIIDLYNVFQAIGIFIIFVCKRQILNQLQVKYPIFKRVGLIPTGSRTTTTITTRISLRTDAEGKHKLPKQCSQNNVLAGTKL